MDFEQGFAPLAASEAHDEAQRRYDGGWRYVQMLAVRTDEGADVIYSYMKDGRLDNLVVEAVPAGGDLASISDVFLEAFVCENEIHDLFGIGFPGLKIDFLGNFYRLSTEAPMTIVSPEQLARLEKERKAKAAAEAKKAKTAGAPGAGDAAEDMEAKLAGMDPAKAAKVRAAMEAKAAKEKAAADAELEAKLAAMDPEKAAKVRAAMEAKAKKEAR